MEQQKTHTFYVQGMHCPSCVILTEGELGDLPQVKTVKADLATLSVTVTGDFASSDPQTIARELTAPMAKHGYTITVEPKSNTAVSWGDFALALPIALVVIILFVVLQKLGIVNWVQTGHVTYSTAFLIGVIASLSTCMAVVGGLILSLSASYSKTDTGYAPAMMFHLGRLISFFILGGVIGAIGSTFTLSTDMTFAFSVLVGLVLFILGINLLDIFPWAKKLQPRLPKQLAQTMLGVKKLHTIVTPALVGAVTFFLPCGFTQSMQLYTLTTGSFMAGSLTMLSFALGTLPILALLSFSSVGIKTPKTRSIFFKAVGIIVLFFAIINILASLISIGLLPPFLTI
jgi:sulfite exporter TauE/SafE/copper chaperone CopZ